MSEDSGSERPGKAMFDAMAKLEAYKQTASGKVTTQSLSQEDIEKGADILAQAHQEGRNLTRVDVQSAVMDHSLPPVQKPEKVTAK